jgi:hypothetical protein
MERAAYEIDLKQTMELILNELSLHHKAINTGDARHLMKNLLETIKDANPFNFNKIRLNVNWLLLHLAENYTISDWLNDPKVRPDFKTLFLGWKRTPFIEEGNENIENRFIENYYYLDMPLMPDLHMQEVEGLAVAFLYNTLSISFASNDVWKKTRIHLIEKREGLDNNVFVKHISCPGHIDSHRQWVEANRPVQLFETDIPPKEKKINLRDDHGKDVLKKFADKLVKSPYITKVINSLPFNPRIRHFIKDIFPDGKIEIVLTHSDEGFGLVVQTTGRNLQETKEIANLIEKEFIP